MREIQHEPAALHEHALCENCPLKGKFVPGEGPRSCSVVAVGASPGEREEATGIAFTGPAGSMVRDILDAIGLAVFYTNVVKRPLNREPTPGECWKCGSHLIRELALVQPDVVLAFGFISTRFFLGARHSLSGLRGLPIPTSRYGWSGLVIPVYDPGFVLRRGGLLSKVGDEWIDDLQDVTKYVE